MSGTADGEPGNNTSTVEGDTGGGQAANGPYVFTVGACKAGEKISRNASYVSRIINRDYAGSYEEAERLVRAAWGNEDVLCPVWNESIPLASCMNNRRRKGAPKNTFEHLYDGACPNCPNNTDIASEARPQESEACAA